MRFKYVLTEVLTGLWRNVTMTVAMIITMGVSLTMLGASHLMVQQVDAMQETFYGKVEVWLFLKDGVTEDQRKALESTLSADPLIRQVTYESKSEAYARFRKIFRSAPDLVEATKEDSLPDSFKIKLKDPEKFQAISDKYKSVPEVDEIIDQQTTLSKVFGILKSVRNVSLFVAIFQGIAALLLVGNTIQIAAYSRRREVAVMKLVGSPNWFIQMPFVLEAVFAGLIGAIFAFVSLVCAKHFLLDGSMSTLSKVFPPIEWRVILMELPILAGISTLVTSVAGWITLRFYVRV